MPQYAEAGERVHIVWDYDQGGVDYLLGPACEENNGHWYCVTCQEGFPHNLAATAHYTGSEAAHKFVWICHVHGPEPVK